MELAAVTSQTAGGPDYRHMTPVIGGGGGADIGHLHERLMYNRGGGQRSDDRRLRVRTGNGWMGGQAIPRALVRLQRPRHRGLSRSPRRMGVGPWCAVLGHDSMGMAEPVFPGLVNPTKRLEAP